MRSANLLLIITLFFLPIIVDAQSIAVTSRKVVYKRTGRDVPKHKRTFEVRHLVFKGRSLVVSRRLKAGTDYWKVFDMNLAENLRDDHWLSSFDFVVKYNKHNILDVWLVMEGVGAYPDGSIAYRVFDLRTGMRLDYRDLFLASRFDGLTKAIRETIKRSEASEASDDVRQMLSDRRENEPEFNPKPDEIDLDDLAGFSISDRGVTFIYDYGYPHVAEALEPSNELFLSYAELKEFIRPDGLLARFIR